MRPETSKPLDWFLRKFPVSKPVTILLVLFLLGLGVWLTKDAFLNAMVTNAIRTITGVQVRMSYVHVHLIEPKAEVKDLLILNPDGFRDPVMVDIPQILVDYDRSELLTRVVHLERLRIDLRELMVERAPSGLVNIEALSAMKANQPQDARPPPSLFRIDTLELHIGRVTYKDYSVSGAPMVEKFNVNLHEQFRNVTDTQSVVALVVVKALMNTTVPQLTNLNLDSLKGQVEGVLSTAATLALDTAKSSVQSKASRILDALPSP